MFSPKSSSGGCLCGVVYFAINTDKTAKTKHCIHISPFNYYAYLYLPGSGGGGEGWGVGWGIVVCMNVLAVLTCESLHVYTVCIWRCEDARFCVEGFMRHICFFYSFIHESKSDFDL